MNCQQAKELIDERAMRSAESARANDAALDAHFGSCAACREYARAVAATDKLLAGVRADRPSNEEMADMWNTLALSLPGQGAVTMKAVRKPRPWLRVAIYSASVAAVLMVALQLGRIEYENAALNPFKSLLRMRYESGGMAEQSNVKGIGTSSKQWATDRSDRFAAAGSDGWGIPVRSETPREDNESSMRRYSMEAVRPPEAPAAVPPAAPKRYRRGSAPGGGLAGGVRPTDAELDASALAARSAAPQVAAAPPPPALEVPATSLPSERNWKGARSRIQVNADAYSDSSKNVLSSDGNANYVRDLPGSVALTSPPNSEFPRRHTARTGGGQSVFGAAAPEDSLDLAFCVDSGIPGETQPASGGGGAAGQAAPEGEQASNVPASAMIIRTGLLSIEVPVYAKVATQVEQIVGAHRGFIGDSNVVEQTGGAIVGTVVIRVPAEQFEGLFAALKGLGRVVSEHSDSDDVTAAYVDLEARIISQRVTEERLHDLVRNKTIVDKVSALLEVERELQRVRSDIERMQGELRVMADRVALSTITLTLSEPKRIVPTASLSVEVGTVDEAGGALGATLTTLNGRLLSGKTNKRSDGTLMATYQLQVPLSRFNELLDAVTEIGRIEERQISDHEFSAVKESWAANVQCSVALTVFERSRQQPSGTMFVEADNLEGAVKKLETVLEPTAARIVSSYSVVDPQGASKAEVTLSVPAANFSELVARLGELGRVQSQSITGETKNASGGAASVLCSIRLTITEVVREVPTGQIIVEVEKFDAARTAVATLVGEKSLQVLDSSSQQNMDGSWRANFELGVEAKDMEDVVGRLEGLGRVASRNMQGIGLGSLSRTDPKALGHLSVSIAEKSAIAPAPEQAGQTLRTHLRDGLEGLYKSVGLIAYGLIVMGPWLAIAILAGWLIGRVRGRRKTNGTSGSAVP